MHSRWNPTWKDEWKGSWCRIFALANHDCNRTFDWWRGGVAIWLMEKCQYVVLLFGPCDFGVEWDWQLLQAKIRMGQLLSHDARLRRQISKTASDISNTKSGGVSYDGASKSNDGSCPTVCSKAAQKCWSNVQSLSSLWMRHIFCLYATQMVHAHWLACFILIQPNFNFWLFMCVCACPLHTLPCQEDRGNLKRKICAKSILMCVCLYH